MTQEDFRNALRSMSAHGLPPAPSAHDMARALVSRDHRRTGLFGVLALFFWFVGAGGLIWLVIALNRFVTFLRIAPGLPWSQARPVPGHQDPFEYMIWGTTFIHRTAPFVCGAIACLLLAAIFTVMMIYASQRATLTRINLSLAELAEQVKRG